MKHSIEVHASVGARDLVLDLLNGTLYERDKELAKARVCSLSADIAFDIERLAQWIREEQEVMRGSSQGNATT